MRRASMLLVALSLIIAACGDDATTDTTEVPEGSVVVPDVVGESAAFATGVLEASGLVASVVEESIEGAEPGTVVEQVPAAGSTADEGATIVLRVAAASEDTTTTTSGESGDSTTTTAGSSGGTTSTTSGGGTGTTAAPTTTAASTTTSGATAPDDGGDGSGSPEYSYDVPADGSAVVHTDAISVPGDRGDGIRIEVTGLNQGENADLHVTFSCDPGGPRVNDAFGYSGGSSCNTTYNTTEFAGYQSYLKSFWIYVPSGVEGLFNYTLTIVAIER